jgi:hypothetical protein
MIEKFQELHKQEHTLRKIICKGAKCIIPPKRVKELVVKKSVLKKASR